MAGELPLTDAVLVTGAGRRIGLDIAERLLARGHPVIAHFHSPTEDIERLRRSGVLCLPGDLQTEAGVLGLAEAVAGAASSLRAIVHNASAFEKTAPGLNDALAQLDRFYAIHVRAPFALNLALAPRLTACRAEQADIVHITDIYADNPNPAFDAYCASKAALQNLTLSFAKRLAPKVKVNAIQPGPVLFKSWHDEDSRKRILAETLLGKEGGAEAIGLAVEAVLGNPYQTGAVIAVDGGRRLK